jgi:GntP family gluconate:H+ symporter
MVGGGKAGNVISPNPNTIAAADAFGVDLTSLMMKNVVPALCALAMTAFLSAMLAKRIGAAVETSVEERGCATEETGLPSLWASVAGPVVVVALLALRPVCGFAVDPLVALPAGGIVSILACGRWRRTAEYCEFGLSKVVGVSILLVGTGTVAGIVKNSGLNADMVSLLDVCHLPAFALAPLSSFLLSGATASTTAGVTIAAQTFSGALLDAGVPALSAAAMLHAGGTIIDALPHGSFFHATAGAVGMNIKDRLKVFPFGALVGATSTVASVIVYLLGF